MFEFVEEPSYSMWSVSNSIWEREKHFVEGRKGILGVLLELQTGKDSQGKPLGLAIRGDGKGDGEEGNTYRQPANDKFRNNICSSIRV